METRVFLQEAAGHLARLTNCHPQVYACDLHPKFTTTALAQELSEANDLSLIQVQHHHAHAAALMAEHSLDELVSIVCDGYGYGLDGKAWGGEVLLSTSQSAKFKRIGHLEPQLLLGGDIASRYPLRIAAGILSKAGYNIESWLMQNSHHLQFGKEEAQLIQKQLTKSSGQIETTSCGRVLDAVAAVLGLCYMRTFEGEPAMKLESAAIGGKNLLHVQPKLHQNILDTTPLIAEIFENKDKISTRDLAYSAHAYLAKGLASLAVDNAVEQHVSTVGFSGGTAANQILSEIMRETVKKSGLKFVVHEAVPAGDGGVSFGQAVVGGFS